MLCIPLVNAERAWAYEMQLKGDITEETSRTRHHMIKRLRRAAKYATELEELLAVRSRACVI